jgi:hypothetical protein
MEGGNFLDTGTVLISAGTSCECDKSLSYHHR